MRETIVLIALLAAAPLALAQEEEPTVNDSDYDTTPPASDEAYLDEAEAEYAEEPTVSDADFDTSVPAGDESYLDDAEAEAEEEAEAAAGDDAGSDTTPRATSDVPGPGLVAVLWIVGALAILRRR